MEISTAILNKKSGNPDVVAKTKNIFLRSKCLRLSMQDLVLQDCMLP